MTEVRISNTSTTSLDLEDCVITIDSKDKRLRFKVSSGVITSWTDLLDTDEDSVYDFGLDNLHISVKGKFV